MITDAFSELIAINGIEAVVVYDNRNQIIDSWNTPKYNPSVFVETGETFQHIFGLLEYLRYDMDELVLPFDRGLVFVRSHSRLYVTVIARLSVEIAHIRMAMNVAIHDIDNGKKWRRTLRKLPEQKFTNINSARLDEVEKIMLENMREGK
ncbi:MAG: hypothetical protein ACRBF0_05720 [Calditrichia bacterium]